MSNLGLYVLAVLIWGSTWLAIKFQLGVVPPAVSVVWRFGLAALILLAYALVRRLPVRFDARTHAWLAAQGLLLFGINYVLVYLAEGALPSGLVAVAFSLIALLNILFLRLFFAVPMKPRALLGAAIGMAGLLLLFWPELRGWAASAGRRVGLVFCLLATVVASLGNMAATRNHRNGIPVIQGNIWAMLYGALFVAVFAAQDGQAFVFDTSAAYVVSLVYLALFGSVVAFVAYLTLLGRIGADRAGYSGIAIPVVAMFLSTLFEHLQWTVWLAAGMLLCLVGNLLALGLGRGATTSRRP